MTDNDVIKALECCSGFKIDGRRDYCFECPLHNDTEICESLLFESVFKLINRQKAEIEKKDIEIDILIRKKETLNDEVAELRAEIENLKKGYEIYEETSGVKWAKTEGIKEFAERLCEGRVSNDPVVIAVKVELKGRKENG